MAPIDKFLSVNDTIQYMYKYTHGFLVLHLGLRSVIIVQIQHVLTTVSVLAFNVRRIRKCICISDKT